MEQKVLLLIVQYLLDHYFSSKKGMATAIAVPYRTLLEVSTGQGGKGTVAEVTGHILRYCIQNQIPLDQVIG